MAKNEQLEQKILEVAEELFLAKGFDAVSTTDIAKKVGCNQALIHYYYRTKERLFYQIFCNKYELLMSYIQWDEQHPKSLKEVLAHFIDSYFALLVKNRNLPFFIINELIMNKERRDFLREALERNAVSNHYYQTIDKMVKREIEIGNIRPIETIDLTLNVFSLVIFTFLTLPLYTDFFYQDESQVDKYLQRRKEEIKQLIFRGIFIQG